MVNLEDQSSDKPHCFDVFESAANLKPSYRFLALVTHPDHVPAAIETLPKDDLLLVSGNWHLWQTCVQNALPCIHANSGLVNWDASAISRDLFFEANTWIYHEGIDRTVFKGVSLGRKFASQSSLAFAEFSRLKTALGEICRQYNPEQIHAFGFRTDYGFLKPKWRNYILQEVATERGAKLVVHDDYFFSPKPDFPTNQKKDSPNPKYHPLTTVISEFGKGLFLCAIVIIGNLRRVISAERPSVLSLLSQLTSIPMINEMGGRQWFMLMIARWYPNKRDPMWMLRSIAKGAIPIDCQPGKLSPGERSELNAIRQSVAIVPNDASKAHAFMAEFAAHELLESEHFEQIAEDVIWADRLLDIYQPQHILTDSLLNSVSGIIIDIAREKRIPISLTLHAHYIQNLKFERLGCDPRAGKQADRFFSWGPITENWLHTSGATAKPVRTGNPISSKFLSKPRPVKRASRNILILQYTIAYSDLRALPHHEYEFFVEMVRALNGLGHNNIRLRLHPGVPKFCYYKDIASHFDLICEINDSGPFEEHLDWADFVIGPVISGAMLEVMASGKHYYPVLLQPTAIDMSHLKGLECYSSSEQVLDAIVKNSPGKQSEMLTAFTSASSHPHPAANIWQAIEHKSGIENLYGEE